MTIRYCIDCKHSETPGSKFEAPICHHPRIIANDPSALASNTRKGVDTFTERLNTSWFAACGRKGKLWEPTK